MGTNFYIRGHQDTMSPEFHIGKRSAAGLYCWDCKRTLWLWFEDKHLCQTSNKNEPSKKTGVASCSSFSWAINPTRFRDALKEIKKCSCCDREYENPEKVIEDEYKRLYTKKEFDQILKECPVQYFDMIDKEFS